MKWFFTWLISSACLTWFFLALQLFFIAPAEAHDFPADKVEYVCRVAPYYVTTPSDACIMEQYQWFVEASQSEHYEKQLWYGQRLNYKGEVVGVDFKPVLDRVRWLSR